MRGYKVLIFSLFATGAVNIGPGVAAEAEGDGAKPDYAAIVQATVTGHIRPAYSRMAKASKNLALIMKAACRTDEGVTTPTITKSFMDVASAWVSVQHIRFGPVKDENRYERISFWPDPKNLTSRQMSAVLVKRDATVINAETLAKKSIALQGLTALERLMTMAPAEDREEAVFRCEYAQAITDNLVQISSSVEADWAADKDFPRLLGTPGPENPLYRDHREAALEVMKSLSAGLQFLHERKLVAPLGETLEKARPKRAEFWRSGTTLDALDANFETLMELYTKSGISAYVKSVDEGLDKTLMTSYEQALVTLKGIEKPFVEAATDKALRPKMDYLRFLAEDLQLRSSGNLANTLGLSLGFNALDGD
ncbi:imelysin family protein [Denitrobaculum tricleocarpae]|uniref:Imelysin family protein n=1 Tax=Denitrobaculum tricleocarpae TaxID=2591009 RepID=A0A545TWT5_9PROT|nr:imelysin family protein [Denitrobaculum tricleocarpae]TQV81672.1 imelysin family protein [Denitrobaculum tricleocarpae]